MVIPDNIIDFIVNNGEIYILHINGKIVIYLAKEGAVEREFVTNKIINQGIFDNISEALSNTPKYLKYLDGQWLRDEERFPFCFKKSYQLFRSSMELNAAKTLRAHGFNNNQIVEMLMDDEFLQEMEDE